MTTVKERDPFGVSTWTVEPTAAFISARPIGDSAESRPSARLASVEPTRVQTFDFPLLSSRISALRPKAKASPRESGSTTTATTSSR